MSTAIMQTAPFYDFGDLLLKNQTASRTMTHNNNNNAATLSNSNNNNNNNNINNNNNYSTTNSGTTALLQQQINAAVHQQQQQHKMLLHNALTRAVSHPQGGNVASLVNSLIENLGHRKLERTQSEPLQQVNASRYKTELCRPFEEAGECKYGDKCQFAHGMHELRNLQRHPKYKTELCRTFHSVGFCPYGPRCHFVHNAEEARAHNRAVSAAYARIAAQQAAAAAAANGGHNNNNNNQHHHHHIPLSPPVSMSTGSDRASPTGSLSLSPTNSMGSFFNDQGSSPTYQQGFAFPNSPPASPRGALTPVTTPPPGDDARLPVFNRLSSAIDAFTNMSI